MAVHLGPRTRKIARIAGFVVFGLITFVIAIQQTFPYDRAVARATEALSDKGWDLNVQSVDASWIPGRVYLHSVRLTSRKTKPDDTEMVFFIKDLKIDVGLLSAIGGNLAVELDAAVAGGKLNAKFDGPFSGKGTYTVKLDGKDLSSESLPMTQILLQPTKGDMNVSADISLTIEPNKAGKNTVNWQKLEGDVELACPTNCIYGDGKTKLKMKLNTRNKGQAEFGKDGIEFGIIKLDSMLAHVESHDGKLKLSKLDVKSADGEVKVDFNMDLQPDLADSSVAGCISYKGSEELLKRDNKSFDAISLIGGALGPDKLFHIRLSEKWRDISKKGVVCGTGSNPNMDEPGGTNPTPTPGIRAGGHRPNLASPPPEGGAATPPTPAPVPPPIQPPAPAQVTPPPPAHPDGTPEQPPGSAPPGAYVPAPAGSGTGAMGSAGSAVPGGSPQPASDHVPEGQPPSGP